MLSIPMPAGRIPGLDLLDQLLPDLACAAQKIYDGWDQVDGYDEELGAGGICQDIASAMTSVLADNGFEHVLSVSASVGENHVFVVAMLPEGIFEVDIPPSRYELGAGYSWVKRVGVTIDATDIVVGRIADGMEPDEFYAAYSE